MAYELVKLKSIKATGSLAASQFCFVKIDTNGQLALPGAGAYAIGVLQDKPAANDPGAVCFPGDITKVQCGGTITAGQEVATDVNGKAVAAVSGNFVLGVALAAGASGSITDIIYQPKSSKL